MNNLSNITVLNLVSDVKLNFRSETSILLKIAYRSRLTDIVTALVKELTGM